MASNTLAEPRNKLLSALSGQARQQWLAQMEPVSLQFGQVLSEANQPIGHVYFPAEGMVSLTVQMQDGTVIEIVTIGNDGLVGLPALLGTTTLPFQALVQVPGHGLRMAASTFHELVSTSEQVNTL